MTKPDFTPLEARNQFGDDLNQTITFKGGTIIMDGPMNSPSEVWTPHVTMPDGSFWCVEGEVGEPITAGTDWAGPFD